VEVNKIYQGDVLSVLSTFPDNLVDCCITSPPYFNLRDYKVEGQIGKERTLDDYITKLIDIFDQVKRVIKPTGSIWVNLGDTFNGTKKGNTNNKQKQGVNEQSINKEPSRNIPEKSMCMIPERFAIRMIEELNLCLRNKIVWHKPNAMPQSAPDRFSLDWEYLYHFTKSKKYYWEQQYRPISNATLKEIQKVYRGQATKDYEQNNVQNPSDTKRRIISNMRNLRADGTYYPIGGRKYVEEGLRSGNPTAPTKITSGIKFGGNKHVGYGPKTYSGKEWKPTIIGDRYVVKYGAGETGIAKSGSEDDPNKRLHTGSWSDKKQSRLLGPQPGTRTYDNAIKLGWNPQTEHYAEWYFTKRQKKSLHGHSQDNTMGMFQVKKRLEDGTPHLDHPYGSKLRSVWSISTRSFPGAHFATFPPKLLETPIRASCPIGGIVLDPFMGAGTTALAALQLNRRFVGIELSKDYIALAYDRIRPCLEQEKLPVS
jgi:DNA modification methylase